MKRLVFILAFGILAVSCSTESIQETDNLFSKEFTAKYANDKGAESELLDLVNEYRTVNGFAPLQMDNTVYSYSGQHTDYMIDEERLSHDNFEDRAQSIVNETGALSVGENVAKASQNLDNIDVVNGWINSAGHKKNIEGDFTHTGIAAKIADDGTKYYTQIFIKK